MATTNDIYAEMQRYAPLELAESWDNPGLLVDCAREVSRVLVTLDITPEVVEEAAAGGCELIVSHHPVIFSPLKKLTPRDVSFQLVQKGISAICMHTNLDAAEGGVNEVLAGIFGMQDWEVFADGCGRVGEVDPITVPELARKANHHAAIDAVRLGLSLVAAGHYATEFPVCAAIADRLLTAFPELEVRVSGENRDPYTYL